jgi:hypothetical protein
VNILLWTDLARKQACHLLSPLHHWDDYVTHRWSSGLFQYEAAQTLAAQGGWTLARAALRASLITSPTIYRRPRRLALLAKATSMAEQAASWSPRDSANDQEKVHFEYA